MLKRWTIAVVAGSGVLLSSCTSSTQTKLMKIYDGGTYEETASLGDNRQDCKGIAKSLNDATTERTEFVCVEVAK